MTDHALRSRNASGPLMSDRVARFVFRNADVARLRHAKISSRLVKLRMSLISVIGIDHVASRAAGRSVITRMIVCAKKIQCRIEQARFLQSEIDWISPLCSAESAYAQS